MKIGQLTRIPRVPIPDSKATLSQMRYFCFRPMLRVTVAVCKNFLLTLILSFRCPRPPMNSPSSSFQRQAGVPEEVRRRAAAIAPPQRRPPLLLRGLLLHGLDHHVAARQPLLPLRGKAAQPAHPLAARHVPPEALQAFQVL